MSRHKKKHLGTCRLCRQENVELTFEHVPPASAYNDKPVHRVSREDSLKCLTDPLRKLWDMDGMHYENQQRGDGDYYLCSECNSKTGDWYVKYYSDFIKNAMVAIAPQNIKHGMCFKLQTKDIRPLAIIKQVLVMFCDINQNLSADVQLRDFLLNPESNDFDSKKYRVFMFGFGGGLLRRSGCFGTFDTISGEALIQSEIISPPVGFNLYIDAPDSMETNDCEITNFAFEPYLKSANVDFILHAKETFSVLPGMYVSREDNINGQA